VEEVVKIVPPYKAALGVTRESSDYL